MDKKQRINFLIISSVLFAVSFISYCLLVMPVYDQVEAIKTMNIAYPFDCFIAAFSISYLLTSVYYLIKLSTVFLEKRKLWVRIASTVFFPITVTVGLIVSFFTTIPYGIYNIVKIASK